MNAGPSPHLDAARRLARRRVLAWKRPGRGRLAGLRMGEPMSLAALLTWIITAGAGLYLLTIWLIEYDGEFQSAAATRLPVPVISAHALLAVAGLVVWVSYILVDNRRLAWAALIILETGAMLGLIMAVRWIGVYRTVTAARTGAAPDPASAEPA